MEQKETLAFITGLRGYAALFVFLIHAGTFLGNINSFSDKLVNFGKYGVTVFFIISAFTLCMSIDRSKLFDFRVYLKKRILRIVPLYYFVMIICFLLGGFLPLAAYYKNLFQLSTFDFANLFYHLTFFSILNQRYQNSLLGVEWTIPLEFFYYLVIPFIFFLARKYSLFLVGLLGMGVFFYLNRTVELPIYQIRLGGGDWAIETYLAVYCMGILAYMIKPTRGKIISIFPNFKHIFSVVVTSGIFIYILKALSTEQRIFWVIGLSLFAYVLFFQQKMLSLVKKNINKQIIQNSSIFFLLVLLGLYINSTILLPDLFLSLFTMVLIFACLEGGVLVRVVFENKFILHIGKISYSFYLFHLLIIAFFTLIPLGNEYLRFISIFLITLLVSTMSEKLIEQPFIARGRNMIAKVNIKKKK